MTTKKELEEKNRELRAKNKELEKLKNERTKELIAEKEKNKKK